MEISVETLAEDFIRTYNQPFTVKDVQTVLSQQNFKVKQTSIKDFLESDPLVFKLNDKEFITRSAIFTNRFFCIKPTRYEINNGILIPGDRCMPFIDPEMLPHELQFSCNGNLFAHKIVQLPSNEVIKHYALYGEEYLPQYISFDPANCELDFSETDYELPQVINMTVLDMDCFYKENDFKVTDRLVLSVKDWDCGIIDVMPVCVHKDNPFDLNEKDEKHQKWFKNIEKRILDSLKFHGPCSSIDAQLCWLFADNMQELSIPECGSFEEYLNHSKKISLSLYGVETRLWKTGEDIPADSSFADAPKSNNIEELQQGKGNMFEAVGLPVNDVVIDCYLYDSLYRKDENIRDVYKRIVPDDFCLDKRLSALILLLLMQRCDMLRNGYNLFADFDIGSIRKRALELYSKLIALVSKFGLSGLNPETSPQQSFVVMTQLFVHATRLVESIQIDSSMSEKERNAILLSLEGMEYSFQDIEEELLDAIAKHEKNSFSLIRKLEEKK